MKVDQMNTATALEQAITYLNLAHGYENKDVNEVITRLEEVLNQRGCEHFDPAVKDGFLTHLIDIIIDG
jgi:hypothetical protein